MSKKGKYTQIFVDSDVVISSMISKKGAAYQLFHNAVVEKIISNYSNKEIQEVAKRLKIKNDIRENVLKICSRIIVKTDNRKIKKNYNKYVFDKNDAHVVAGAHAAKVRFLVTYNIKDFKIESIKRDMDIIILTPGMFLQYLRSVC